MALNAYLKLTGETVGDVNGSVTQAGREDMIMVIGFEHDVVAPRDAASGKPTGKRQHMPVTITKEIDVSTPVLYKVMVENENITDWRLDFWEPSTTGQEKQHYTIQLTNASISGIRAEMLNNKYPENMQHKEREHISFHYQKIQWIWHEGGIEHVDDWEAPVI